jgi:hypothetical protein
MAEPDDLVPAPLGTEEQRGKEVWNGTVALADGAPTWTASATCWTSGLIGCVWGTTGAAPAAPCAARMSPKPPPAGELHADRRAPSGGGCSTARPGRGAGARRCPIRRDESFCR